jgi:hypothetical protein
MRTEEELKAEGERLLLRNMVSDAVLVAHGNLAIVEHLSERASLGRDTAGKRCVIVKLNEQNMALEDALRVLRNDQAFAANFRSGSVESGVKHLHVDAVSSAKERPALQDIADGKVVIDFPQPEHRKLEANEVHLDDTKKLAEIDLADVASGKVRLVNG